MKKIIFKSEELAEAVKKVSPSVKDGITITVTSSKAESGEDTCTIIASDGKTQANIITGCKNGSKEPLVLKLGAEFRDVVSTLAPCGEKFTLEIHDTYVMVKAGTSQVPVSIKTEVTALNVAKPSKDSLVMKVDSDEFYEKVLEGGYAFTDNGKNAAVVNAIACVPYRNGESNEIRIVSLNADGHTMAGSICKVTVMDNSEAFQNAINEKKVFMLNGPFLMKLLNGIVYKDIFIYITDKQAVIRDGNDVFVMTLRDGKGFPYQMVATLFEGNGNEFKFTVDKKQLKTASMVAVLNATTDRRKNLIKCVLSENRLEISSIDGKNITILEVEEAVGAVTFGLNVNYLKELLDHHGDKVTLTGISETNPIYARSNDTSVSLLLPCNIDEDEEDKKESKSKKKSTEKKIAEKDSTEEE